MTDFSSAYSPNLAGTVAFGDLVMAGGDLVLTADANPAGTQPILQDIIKRLLTFQGECFVDATLGLPWYQQVLGVKQGLSSGTFASTVADAILATPGVIRLDTLSVNFKDATRLLAISFSAVTQGGMVSYDGSLSAASTSGGGG